MEHWSKFFFFFYGATAHIEPWPSLCVASKTRTLAFVFHVFVPSNLIGRLGGVTVSVLATEPKGYGSNTRPRRWICKDDKNPQHNFLSDGK
jgi:hypothetical protein